MSGVVIDLTEDEKPVCEDAKFWSGSFRLTSNSLASVPNPITFDALLGEVYLEESFLVCISHF